MSENLYFLVRHDGEIFPFGDQGASLGRHSSNSIVISDASASRQHARVLVAEGRCWIRDENSVGGTFVNEQRVQGQQEISPGDILQVGNTNFRFGYSQGNNESIPKRKNQLILLVGAAAIIIISVLFMGLPGNNRTIPPGGSSSYAGVASDDETIADLGTTSDEDDSEPIVRNSVTNNRGQASFRDPGTGENVLINVVDENGQPQPDMDVIYMHGVEYAYEAYFVQNSQEQTVGVGFFPHNSEHEVKIMPNVMHAVNPDERQAIEGYLGDMAKRSKDFYQDTLTSDEMLGVYERAETINHVFLHFLLPHKVALGWLLVSLPGDEPEIEELPDIGQWDHYHSYSAYIGRTETLVYIESQPPVMQPIEVVANNTESVTLAWYAIDPTKYPDRPAYKADLLDHTIFLGASAFSDLTYHYRILDNRGNIFINWSDLFDSAVCMNGVCNETEITKDDLPDGQYRIEVYATDEVGNDSEIISKEFSISGSTVESLSVEFNVDAWVIERGDCVVFNWDVSGSNVNNVTFDRSSYVLTAKDTRCPTTTSEYHFEVVSQSGEVVHLESVVITVNEPLATIITNTPKPKPTDTPKPEKPTIYLSVNARCRSGNSKDFPDVWFFDAGTSLEIIGTDGNGWYKIKFSDPRTRKTECWIGVGEVRGNSSSIQVVETPPPQLQSFSNVSVNTKEIVISVWDNASIDGDRIRLTLNNNVLLGDYTLTGNPYSLNVTLNPGANYLVVTALNVGSQPPNTVTVSISNVTSGSSEQTAAGLHAGASQMIITAP